MKKSFLLSYVYILILSILIMSACSKNNDEESSSSYQIYFIDSEQNKLVTKDYYIDEISLLDTMNRLLTIMSISPEEENLKAVFSITNEPLEAYCENSTAYINLDSSYLSLDSADEILIRGALVLTLCQIDGIDSLNITVENEELTDDSSNIIGNMSPDMFLISDGDSFNIFKQSDLLLYYANKGADRLVKVSRHVSYSGDISDEKLIIYELLKSPTEDNAYASIPEKTKLNLVRVVDGICYVDFSEEFLKSGNIPIEISVYSIVNSLMELEDVNKVVIYINGENNEFIKNKFGKNEFEANYNIL